MKETQTMIDEGSRLYVLRSLMGKKQYEIAGIMNVDPGRYSLMEKGRSNISSDRMQKVEDFFLEWSKEEMEILTEGMKYIIGLRDSIQNERKAGYRIQTR